MASPGLKTRDVMLCEKDQMPQGGAESLAEGSDSAWALPLGAALLSIRQVGLGGWNPRECMALENEIGCWQQAGDINTKENALR